MRTTLDIPEELIHEATKLLQFKSKTDIVIYSLKELIRRAQINELRNMAGKITVKVDLKKSRRRR
jgi:Arc/MetJ family transcription regulator